MAKTLEINSKVVVDGFGVCTVKRLAWASLLSNHYFVTTRFGDRVRICWNPMVEKWVQCSQH